MDECQINGYHGNSVGVNKLTPHLCTIVGFLLLIMAILSALYGHIFTTCIWIFYSMICFTLAVLYQYHILTGLDDYNGYDQDV